MFLVKTSYQWHYLTELNQFKHYLKFKLTKATYDSTYISAVVELKVIWCSIIVEALRNFDKHKKTQRSWSFGLVVSLYTEFIVDAFNVIAQPDWWLWDILKECFPNEEVVTVWSADALCDILGTRLTTIVGDKASMKVVVDWLHTWRQAESNSRARNKETDYLVAYRNRNEAWNYYRLCTIRFDNQGDYRERIRNLPTILLIINRTYAMSKVMWRQY